MSDEIRTRPATREYLEGYIETFGKSEDPYCSGCGRLLMWCECLEGIPGAQRFGVGDIVDSLLGRKP